ncbi:MAG: TonB-dependent receptor [Pseudomonadota bacterium]|nr:TonB-dependent receptor [Pseudomonadota bacterium]
MRLTPAPQWIALAAMFGAASAPAETAAAADAVRLPPVVVTATRTEANPFDVPASITSIEGADVRGDRAQVSVAESLALVPGLQARDRQNFAQDVQVSVRGFGARSSFGIRGVRVYVDGIPATMPDGQGQLSHVDLASVDRIEVLRGPFSALYGNSSGGVLQVFTEAGRGPPKLATTVTTGSDGASRVGVKLSGSQGGLGYLASASGFETDGYRDHSAARRRQANFKLDWKPGAAHKLTLVLNELSLPLAQDPLGLSRVQFDSDPRGVDPSALAFNTRKTVEQTQLGLVLESTLDEANALRVMVYGGRRETVQFQSIPVSAQASPRHPGGVIALERDYLGLDLRWTTKRRLIEVPVTVVAGLSLDTLREGRQGYQNFVGSALGVQGALRRDERNRARNADPYLQASAELSPRASVSLGLRQSNVRFESADRYVTAANPDDSGSVHYSQTLPVLGVLYKLSGQTHLYATVGRGFETPTLNELAYRADGGTGLNTGLKAARSDNAELGIKLRRPGWGDLDAAVFNTRTRDELATLSNSGGRSTYRNAGVTERHGVELAWSATVRDNWRAQLAYTGLDAIYRDAFLSCAGTPCTVPNLAIAAGNRIPGIPTSSITAALAWVPPQGFRAGLEWRALSRVPVNDANTESAAGFTTTSLSAGYSAHLQQAALSGFVRLDNVLARRYAGSVIVNEGNGRYFEPAAGRTWLLGLSASVGF